MFYLPDRTCPSLSTFYVNINTTHNNYGTKVSLTSLTGYLFADGNTTKVVECLSSGNWSDEIVVKGIAY